MKPYFGNMGAFLVLVIVGWALSVDYTHADDADDDVNETVVADVERRTTAHPDIRLDGKLVPLQYDLEISTGIDQDDFDFWGRVRIQMMCTADTKRIRLHSKDLSIDTENVALWELAPGVEPPITIMNHTFWDYADFYTATTARTLERGKTYIYSVPFSGKLADPELDPSHFPKGFFRTSYFDKETQKRKFMAATHFEAIYARRAFPCFDEPGMKAYFSITVGHPQGLTALSNMPIRRTIPMENMPGWVLDEFELTPRMSTYLVAFTVSDFVRSTILSIDASDQSGVVEESDEKYGSSRVLISVWAPRLFQDTARPFGNMTRAARWILSRAVPLLEGKFRSPLQVPWVNMIAVPRFPYQGMENWGLIMYMDVALLCKDDICSNEEIIYETVLHELIHQWIGNLVTVEWWNELWLQEGVTYFLVLIINEIIMKQEFPVYNNNNKYGQIIEHAFKNRKPVRPRTLINSNQIEALSMTSGDLVYLKGAMMTRMMYHFLGGKVFFAALAQYLRVYKFQSVTQDQFHSLMTAHGYKENVIRPDITVNRVMDKWLSLSGYPVLNVRFNADKQVYTVHQGKYGCRECQAELLPARPSLTAKTLWPIPISYASASKPHFNQTKPRMWLRGKGPITVPNLKYEGKHEWIIFNVQVTGMYRVNYFSEMWAILCARLVDPLTMRTIHPLNRFQLLNDMAALARAGHLNYTVPFCAYRYLKHEENQMVLNEGLDNLKQLDIILRGMPAYTYFKTYMHEILLPLTRGIPSIKDSLNDADSLTRISKMMQLDNYYDIGSYKGESLGIFSRWLNKNDSASSDEMPPVILEGALCSAIRAGDLNEWDSLWEKFINPDKEIASKGTLILSALSCSRKKEILERYLERMLENLRLRKLDLPTETFTAIFESVATRSDVGFSAAWNFLKRKVADIHALVGDANSEMGKYVTVVAKQMKWVTEYDDVKTFAEQNERYLQRSRPEIVAALKSIEDNNKWFEEVYGEVSNILEASVG